MSEFLKVEGHKDLVRDTSTGAILNIGRRNRRKSLKTSKDGAADDEHFKMLEAHV